MAQRRKSIRRKSLRRNNRTTLKRGGVKGKITDYFKGQKTGQSNIKPSIQVTQTPGVFYREPDYKAKMPLKKQEEIQQQFDNNLKNYSNKQGILNQDSYPSVNRNIRKI